ncbi:ssDNA-binding domain-containing protein [Vibrio natriegens]|uniref:ArdC family protein n=1 Tax=Vibrio natriegens TaxID=691 RepID=UPI001EFDB0E0|nr:zincin-like metallopeptidase domain-containing protein [Vibrio natriegens]MCG9702486.1 ssDNA-binding domain-containing protein [Vibrio natriegens]
MNKPNPATTHAQNIADLLITQIEAGTAPWQKPWDAEKSVRPHNALTQNAYKGGNALYLQALQTLNGYEDPRWMTYKQAQSVGAQVRKGEKSSTIVHYKFEETKKEKQPDGSIIEVTEKLDRPRAFEAKVFNAEQIDGLEPYKAPELKWQPNEKAEALLAASQAIIKHDEIDEAYYSPSKDEIHLPGKTAFSDETKYYGTALHELGHWTGHSDRLDRDLSGRFGSESYAKEELRAEIASMLIAQDTGVPNEPHNNAAYIKSWVKVLKDDPAEIARAARDAELISKYVMDLDKTLEHDLAKENVQEAVEAQLDALTSQTMVYSLNKETETFHATFIQDTGLGEDYQDIHNGVFLTGSDDNEATSRLLTALSDSTVIHSMSDPKSLIETALEDAPDDKMLLVFGDEDTKRELKEHAPKVHVMTPKDISFSAKDFESATKDKGIEHTKRLISQTQYGRQNKLERHLAHTKEQEKTNTRSVDKTTSIEID